jgi:hypothetical protein
VVYLPVGGEIQLTLAETISYTAAWFNPQTGELEAGEVERNGTILYGVAPESANQQPENRPADWVLVLRGETA